MRAECYSLYVICTYVCIYMYIVVSVTKSRAEHNDETVVMFAEKIHCSDLINRQPSLPLPPYFNAACFFRTSHNLAKSGKFSRSALKIRITCFTITHSLWSKNYIRVSGRCDCEGYFSLARQRQLFLI